jgi:hypothetical protein
MVFLRGNTAVQIKIRMREFIKQIARIFVIAFSVAIILMSTNACGQSYTLTKAQKESTAVRAVSLRELIGENEYGQNDLAYFFSHYYDIKPEIIREDASIKNQMIGSFIHEAVQHGYKMPKKISGQDPFDPYIWLADLQIAFNRYGYMIPAEKFYEQIEGTGTIIGEHDEKVVFDHHIED